MFEKYFTVLFILVCPIISFSQATKKIHFVNGQIIDSTNSFPLGLATVALYLQNDSSIVDFRMSNLNGEFIIPNLPFNKKIKIVITYSGYNVYKNNFELNDSNQNVNLGIVRLSPKIVSLNEIIIQSERPPVLVRKDTIEFNASSFKTLPTAFVEDLLKKLPGVYIDNDGNIVFNGKRVNRILVNGKEFFGGNTRLATKNLPANIIDKVQVVNDTDELLENPDKSISTVGKVINLTLKKGLNNGLFGKAYGGYGSTNRYEIGSLMNVFRDTLQVSFIGYSNNLNRASFGLNDLRTLGGFDRSGINSISSSNSGITVNDISFGGTGEGIQEAGGAGININNVFKNGVTFNTQFFYGKTQNDISENIIRKQYFGNDSSLNTNASRNEKIDANSKKLNFTIRFNIDSTTKLDFRPGLTFTELGSNRRSVAENTFNNSSLTSTSNNLQSLNAKAFNYSHTLNITKTFRKKGETLNFYQLLNYDNNNRNQVNLISEIYFPSSVKLVDQLRYRTQNNISVSSLLTYNLPITKSDRIRLVYNLNIGNGTDTINTYNKNNINSNYDILNQLLSNAFKRYSSKNSLSSTWIKKIKQINLSLGLTLSKLKINNDYRSAILEDKNEYFNVFPVLNFEWKEFALNYNKSLVPPSITDLQSVPDNTNSLTNILGNPLLKPSKVNNFSFNYFKNVSAKSLYINVYFNGYFYEDGVTRIKTIDSSGFQTTIPINSKSLKNYFTFLTIGKQFKLNKKNSINITGGYTVNFSQNYLQINDTKSIVKVYNISTYIRTGFNSNDLFELNFSYKPEFNFTRNSSHIENNNVTRLNVNTDFVLRWPKNIVIETSLDYKQMSQTLADPSKNIALLNCGITYVFFKEKKGQLKLFFYDLLNQNVVFTRIVSDNIITEKTTNVLSKYVLLTFSYNIRSFKPEKIGGRSSLFLF